MKHEAGPMMKIPGYQMKRGLTACFIVDRPVLMKAAKNPIS
jgi:hypothetical protein